MPNRSNGNTLVFPGILVTFFLRQATSRQRLEKAFGAQKAKVLYCCADDEVYFPEATSIRWDLGYMGTCSEDRQPTVDALPIQCAAMAGNR
jgi:spore maturation protein CgeB